MPVDDEPWAVATANGSFGELLQGVLPGGVDFLVTLPVARWSRARFRLVAGHPLRVLPPGKAKARQLAELMLATRGRGLGGSLWLDGDVPVGKGMASSSADLVATARAVGTALGLDTSPEAVTGWLRGIEPTDGVMYPGVVAFEHRSVRLLASLGDLPPNTVVGLDEGGQLDSLQFNRVAKPYSVADMREYADLLGTLTAAVRDGDLRTVGHVATRSCELLEKIRCHPALPNMLRICRQVDGLGVVCTHSGTMLGLLLDDGLPGSDQQRAEVVKRCRALTGVVAVHRYLAAGDPVSDLRMGWRRAV